MHKKNEKGSIQQVVVTKIGYLRLTIRERLCWKKTTNNNNPGRLDKINDQSKERNLKMQEKYVSYSSGSKSIGDSCVTGTLCVPNKTKNKTIQSMTDEETISSMEWRS